MKLDEVLSIAGKNKGRKRVGRGSGSGMGKTSGRGHKGYSSRPGAKKRLGFEGGQNPAIARLPKRGFNNVNFAKVYQIINVCQLEQFDSDTKVDSAALVDAGLIDNVDTDVKVLGQGQISKKLTVVAAKFSASAAKKIQDAGGAIEQA